VSETAQQAIHGIPEQGIRNSWVYCILKVLVSAHCLQGESAAVVSGLAFRHVKSASTQS